MQCRPALTAIMDQYSMDSQAALHALVAENAEHGIGPDKNGNILLTSHHFGNFDASKRDPEYATSGAGPSLWETALLRHHFHPSVQAFSSCLSKQAILSN